MGDKNKQKKTAKELKAENHAKLMAEKGKVVQINTNKTSQPTPDKKAA
jgi:histidinol phosphatase-like PHP family hydrolase